MNTANKKNASTGGMTLSETILSGARTVTYPAGYQFESHMHTDVEMYRILSGKCEMKIQSHQLCCQEGDFIMILPDVIHSLKLNDTDDCTFWQFHFNPRMFSDIVLENDGIYPITLLQALSFSARFFYRLEADQVIDGYLRKMLELFEASDSLFSAANINVALMNLMLHILDNAKPNHNFTESHLQNSYVAYTLNYVQEHYTSKIRQEDISSQLHISVRYLSKVFKEYMGISLSSYINMYRINRSIELMHNSALSLTEIALLVGFKDSQRYSKVFTSVINTTPSNYRKNILK